MALSSARPKRPPTPPTAPFLHPTPPALLSSVDFKRPPTAKEEEEEEETAEFKDDSCFYSRGGKSLSGVKRKRKKLLSAMPEILITGAISGDGLAVQSSRLQAFRTLIANMLPVMRSFIATPPA